ncbi:MAG TPA: hypothetical protein VEW42_04670 [Candidatus Eisenbacteria bacterium]|nr:hypothetical protein [Candidatus Eisenbacteria bacterium]
MASKKQSDAAKKNIKKAQQAWKKMTSRQHSLAQPQGKSRKRPGEVGEGMYFRVVVRPKSEFVTFRNHDVGRKGGALQRLAGKRQSGSWDTQAWLINKKSAHIQGDILVADSHDVQDLLDTLGSKPVHVKGDIFKAKDRPNIPEKEKPTLAQRKARLENIEKAQHARWRSGMSSHQV